MPKQFILNIGGTQAIAELLEQEAPHITQCFWENLPTNSFSVHAKFAGQEMIVMVPFYAEPENEILAVQPGDIGYYPGRQTMCIFYGDTQPFGYVSVFARIVSRVEDLHAVGERLLSAGVLTAHLERLTVQDGGDSAGHVSSPFTHVRSGSRLEENCYEQALDEPARGQTNLSC